MSDNSLSRRGFSGLAGVAALAAVSGPSVARAAADPSPRPAPKRTRGTELVLLGTAGGPPPYGDRLGISSALVVNGRTYVVDCGRGAVTQYLRAGLAMPALDSIFITHLHADHIVGYFDFPLLCAGVMPPQPGFGRVVHAYGPGPAGALTGPVVPADPIAPDGPAPGLAETTRRLNESFSYSSNAFVSEGFGIDPLSMLTVHDIEVPDVGASPHGPTAPPMRPFTVMENDDVRVSAILVPHGNVYPAFAYRFDTDTGSVVFSGDTTRSENLNRLARHADVLVHEAADAAWFTEQGLPAPVVEHVKAVHTDISDIGTVGAETDAGCVVLSHLAPASPDARSGAEWRRAARAGARAAGYGGKILAGHDLLRLDVRR